MQLMQLDVGNDKIYSQSVVNSKYKQMDMYLFAIIQTDRQKATHMRPSCNMDRWAQKLKWYSLELNVFHL